jgi:hypothetical protein
MVAPVVITVGEYADEDVIVTEMYPSGERLRTTRVVPGRSCIVQLAPFRRISIDREAEVRENVGSATADQLRDLNGLVARIVDRRRRPNQDPAAIADMVLHQINAPNLEPWLRRLRLWNEQEEAQHGGQQPTE